MLAFITWDFDPAIFTIGSFEIRYYGLLWALSFFLGFTLVKSLYKKEGIDDKLMDPLLYSVLIGAVVGARLGHVFFYDWAYYQDHLIEIPNIRQGGLASHGGAVGVILASWWYARNRIKRSLLFVMDKLVLAGAMAGAFIRLGNFFNHEIVGTKSDLPWAVQFMQAGMRRVENAEGEIVQLVDLSADPRHPAQLYEALAYALVFALLLFLYKKRDWYKKEGKLFGLFLVVVFIARFFIEEVKVSQEGIETLVDEALSTGQLLSIPFVLVGAYLMLKAKPAKEENASS